MCVSDLYRLYLVCDCIIKSTENLTSVQIHTTKHNRNVFLKLELVSKDKVIFSFTGVLQKLSFLKICGNFIWLQFILNLHLILPAAQWIAAWIHCCVLLYQVNTVRKPTDVYKNLSESKQSGQWEHHGSRSFLIADAFKTGLLLMRRAIKFALIW